MSKQLAMCHLLMTTQRLYYNLPLVEAIALQELFEVLSFIFKTVLDSVLKILQNTLACFNRDISDMGLNTMLQFKDRLRMCCIHLAL